ncbi:aldehyde ferredoxin oxidoreductase family protein [uncultured Desulfosarcina sp.]|uniref:aldehyde ferredoxin oxidoreductase family protein n=1 Tax=uncultured Desulfosarcina sp. TaxID=218289 RepID=UPI0029C76FE1|nr:aldehyde ferredoxin oxidoreductase family protein [uncultured Desulfosarcina sp.]
MYGFFKKALSVDVSNRTHRVESLDETLLRTCMGGKGLGTRLLLDHNPVGVDPLSPANHLILALGPATDSPLHGSCRHGIYSKSPLTGLYAESYSGGSAAIAMSRAGFDAFLISGMAESPIWLEISDQGVFFHPANDLWGLDTFETEAVLRKKVAAKSPGILVIGPAGENCVRFAVIKNDGWRVAGRTGMGAVLGSKKIKAVVFHGSASRPFADPQRIKAYARQMLKDLKNHPAAEAYRNHGTPMMVDVLNNAGGFPSRYWSQGSVQQRENINAQSIKDRCRPRPTACRTCFLACGKSIEVQQGRHQGLKLEGPEYETIYAFGGLCMIEEIEEIVFLNDLCDRMGLDTMTAGNLAALAIEARRRGKIDLEIDYNQPDQIAALLKKIVIRQDVGGLLAEGIRPASEELGLEDLAVHVKGLEPSGYDPRALKGMGLAYAVADRGACHLRTTFYKPELAGMIAPDQIEDKAALFIDFEDRCTLFDTLILCRFYRDLYPWEELGKMLALTTGEQLEKPDLQALAARVTDSARRFNLQEGLRITDDWLPKRLLNEALPDGRRITEADLRQLIDDYYRLRGWRENGHLPATDA